MENRVIMLFFIIILFSFLFTVSSVIILKIRERSRLPVLPILWAALFIATVIPAKYTNYRELTLYKDYSGGLRIEIHDPAEPEEIYREKYIPYRTMQIIRGISKSVAYIWVISTTASFTLGTAAHFNGLHYLTKNSSECRDERVLRLFEAARKKAGLKRHIVLRVMNSGHPISPCTCGIIYPTVYVGCDYINELDELHLKLLFLHELTHIKHGDPLFRFLILIFSSCHSLIPVSRKIKRAIVEDLEYLCDDSVLDKVGDNLRGVYISMIIDSAERSLRENSSGDGFFSYLAANDSVILKRYRYMCRRAENHGKNKNTAFLLTMLVLFTASVLNIILISSFGVMNYSNLGIDISDTFLRNALVEYFELDDCRSLRESHINEIYSIEYSLINPRDIKGLSIPSKYLLECTLNEGFLESDHEVINSAKPGRKPKYSYTPYPEFITTSQFMRRFGSLNGTDLDVIASHYIEIQISGKSCLLAEYEIESAAKILNYECERGMLIPFFTESNIVDTRDISLFNSLRTLIFSDNTASQDESIYVTDKFAVISRK